MSYASLDRVTTRFLLILSLVSCLNSSLTAQEAKPESPKVPVIPEEPKTVDPATLVHPKLGQKATVEFKEASLAELGVWLEKETVLPVVFDTAELKNEGISLNDEYSDRLNDAPIYFLLNRLESFALGWEVRDEVIRITTEIALQEQLGTKTYTVGDMLDDGFDGDAIIEAIQDVTSGPWMDIDQAGGDIQLLGDVLFVRQTNGVHMEIAGLLNALRKHGRETFTLAPPVHLQIRERLQDKISVKFEKESLFRVASVLSEQTGLDVRLDLSELSNEGISRRDTVSLVLLDRKLQTVLELLFSKMGLTTVTDNGVLLVTTEIKASELLQAAVYDVRDLCRDESEADALISAMLEQTSGPWFNIDSEGGTILSPKPGIMVVRQTEDVLTEVRTLLERYREALRNSKPRIRGDQVNDEEVITHFYKVDTEIAKSLSAGLWDLIPDSKEDKKAEDAKDLGKIQIFPSRSVVRDAKGNVVVGGKQSSATVMVVPQATMIITHRRRKHKEIQEVISRIENGDLPLFSADGTPIDYTPYGGGGGYGGGGMQGGQRKGGQQGGGFGGGFFSVPQKK